MFVELSPFDNRDPSKNNDDINKGSRRYSHFVQTQSIVN